VNDRERARALDLLGECEDCATLFADLGATADATAALPVPARPRDFSLTEADATRLRRARRGRGLLSALRRTRAIGSSLVAIGLVGLVATASVGILGGSAGPLGLDASNYRFAADSATAAAPVAMGLSAESSSAPAVAPAMSTAPVATLAPAAASTTDGTVVRAGSSAPASTGQVAVPAGSGIAASPSAPGNQFGPLDKSTGDGAGASGGVAISASTGSTGLDARLIWLGGFGLLFLAGVLVLVGPLIRRRRAR
jgi:hypothetical protein